MTCPSEFLISSRTDLSRSSNWPRYCAPATIAPRSSATSFLSRSDSGTSPATIRWARPSTIAVLPTPGSPISTGLFLVRRDSTWMTRRISESRPMTGSILPSRALRGQVDAVLLQRLVGLLGVGGGDPAVAAADGRERGDQVVLGGAGLASARWPTAPPTRARPASRCSVETYSSPSGRAICSAAPIALTNSRARRGLGDAGAAGGGQLLDRALRRPGARRRGWRRRRAAAPAAVEPPVSSSDSSRCHGSTVACPRWFAVATAPVMTSRLLVVRRSVFMGSPGAAVH